MRRFRLLPDDPAIGWVPYVWLLYLGFVFLHPVLGGVADEPMIWVVSTTATLLFLPLYFGAYWVHGVRKLWFALAIAVIGATLAPLNTGAGTFFIFSAYFAGVSSERPSRSVWAVGLIGVLTGLVAWFLAPTVYFWGPSVLGVLIIGAIGVQIAYREDQLSELRMAQAEVEALARIAERERIASDLHDLLGHTLSVIALKSELAQHLVTRDPERASKELADVHSVARQALAEVRTAVGGYRVGSGAGLRQELHGAEVALEAAGVKMVVEQGPEQIAARLDAVHEGVLALAVREAATNIMRHAGATTCWVAFFEQGDRYGVEVRDDGRGPGGRPGHGLSGMKRRVEALGGSMELSGRRGGTRLRLTFVPDAAEEDSVSDDEEDAA